MAGPLTDKSFSDFPELSPESLAVLDRLGFELATPVQAATIPLFIGNKDVVVDACTGSGKTLAFVLPLVEKLRRLEQALRKHEIGAVVVSPTRELAAQTYEVALPFVESVPKMKSSLLVGGTDIQVDFANLSSGGANVLMGTPGRLADVLLRCKMLCTSTVEVLVLDEADRLLDLGFEATLLSIIRMLPKQRRTGLFSATQAEAVETLVRAGMRNPIRVNVATTREIKGQLEKVENLNQKTPSSLRAEYVLCSLEEKTQQLVHFILENQSKKIMVYFLTCACVDYFFMAMRRLPQLKGVFIKSLHGKMKQIGRQKALKAFTENAQGVLLSTDVAARGLDIPDVDWVIQVDAPQDPAAFVHRVGRTARMGRQGCARIYLTPEEEPYADFIKLRKVPLCRVDPVPGATSVRNDLRKFSESDREIMTKGILAFVSYIRAYANHHCSYIFRLANIDYVGLAYARGLLTLPKVPEIKRFCKNSESFTASEMKLEEVPFQDQGKEKKRLKAIAKEQEKESEHLLLKKQDARRVADTGSGFTREKKCRNPQKRDFDELQGDYALLKLVKKGRITEHEFDAAMGIDVNDDSVAGRKPVIGSQPVPNSELGTEHEHEHEHEKGFGAAVAKGKGSKSRKKRRGVNKRLRNKLL